MKNTDLRKAAIEFLEDTRDHFTDQDIEVEMQKRIDHRKKRLSEKSAKQSEKKHKKRLPFNLD